MNCTVYLFGKFGQGITSSVNDYTKSMFDQFISYSEAPTQIIIHRNGAIMNYGYVRKIANNHLFGICAQINGQYISHPQKLFEVFENIISCSCELFGWERKKSCLFNGIAMFFLSLPCVLGFNVWSSFQPLGPGTGVLDLEDFVVSNLLLPTGALLYVLFCVTRYGWGWDKFVKEANEGQGLKVAKWMRPYMTYVLPVIILIILIMGII